MVGRRRERERVGDKRKDGRSVALGTVKKLCVCVCVVHSHACVCVCVGGTEAQRQTRVIWWDRDKGEREGERHSAGVRE